jgi:type I restriction enzyme R subunit
MRSPLSFRQMVGRGTRLYPPDNKLAFRVYDYTGATDLFGGEFITADPGERGGAEVGEGEGDEGEEGEREPVIEVVGFDVRVTDAGRYIVTEVDGKAQPVTVEEYKQAIAARLVAEAPDLGAFREQWIDPEARRLLLLDLPGRGQSVELVRTLEAMEAYDLYDVLAELGYGMAPLTRVERAEAFAYKHAAWLAGMPQPAANTIRALTAQFARGGTEQLESVYIWRARAVREAGGVAALRESGTPADVLRDTKARMFAA